MLDHMASLGFNVLCLPPECPARFGWHGYFAQVVGTAACLRMDLSRGCGERKCLSDIYWLDLEYLPWVSMDLNIFAAEREMCFRNGIIVDIFRA